MASSNIAGVGILAHGTGCSLNCLAAVGAGSGLKDVIPDQFTWFPAGQTGIGYTQRVDTGEHRVCSNTADKGLGCVPNSWNNCTISYSNRLSVLHCSVLSNGLAFHMHSSLRHTCIAVISLCLATNISNG